MNRKGNKQTARTNWPITILLIIGCLTIFFPLYMTIIIAFKQPSEMTNDIAGALAFPSSWSFSNFAQAMEVTDFWNSLANSVLITVIAIVLAVIIHSLAGYAIGRSMAHSKVYSFIYLYIVHCKRYVRTICNPDDAGCKADGTDGAGQQSGRYPFVYRILYAYEPAAVLRLSEEYPSGAGRSSKGRRSNHMEDLLEYHLPGYETHACNGSSSDCSGYLERRYDSSGHPFRNRCKHTASGTVKLPDTVRYKLQPGLCILPAGPDSDPDLLSGMPETDPQRRCKRCCKIISL